MAESTNVYIGDLPTEVDDDMLKKVFDAYGTVTWSKVMSSKGKPTNSAIVEFANVAEAKWVVENLNGNIAEGLTSPITVNFKRERSKGYDKGYGKGYDKGYDKGGYGKASGKGKWEDGKGKGYSPYEGGKSYGKSDGGKSWGGKSYGGEDSYGGKSYGKSYDSYPKPSRPEGTNIYIADLPTDVDDDKLLKVFGAYGTVTWSKVMASKGKPTNSAIVEFSDVAEAKWVVENLNGNIAEGLTTPITVMFKAQKSKGYGKGSEKGDGGYGKGGKGKYDGGKSWGGKSYGGK